MKDSLIIHEPFKKLQVCIGFPSTIFLKIYSFGKCKSSYFPILLTHFSRKFEYIKILEKWQNFN